MPRRNIKQKYNAQVPTPSPPTQLPTPLPEEERIKAANAMAPVDDDRLIDFDTPTPPQHPIHLDLHDEEDDILTHTYRSPPFREVRLSDLSDHSPPPLPVPPRSYHQQENYDDQPSYGGDSASSSSGHTRWPTYSSTNTRSSSRNASNSLFAAFPTSLPNVHIPTRSPSRHSARQPIPSHLQTQSPFHSLTRTLRSYVPSSIHIPIPSAAPSPPLVSRPVSFGRFSSDSGMDTTNSELGLGFGDALRGRKPAQRQEFERDYEREGEEDYVYGGHEYGYGYQQPPSTSGLARPMSQNPPPGFNTTVNSSITALDKSSGRLDVIEWATWDVLGDRRFLILGYPAGLQIWDCSDLNAISEVLNLNFDSAEWKMILGSGKGGSTNSQEEASVIHAAMLPSPSDTHTDLFSSDRPLLGILMQMVHTEDDYDEECESSLVLYSLRNHHLVKRLPLSGAPSTFIANDQFTVVSMGSPPTLLVLSSTRFQTLYIVPSSSLEPFSPLPHQSSSATASSSTLSSSTQLGPQTIPSSLSTARSPTISSNHVPLSPLSIGNISSDTSGSHPRRRRRRRYLDEPQPVFALSHRLLAYASPSPTSSPQVSSNKRLSSASSNSSNPNSSLSSSPSPFGLGGSIGMVGKVTNMTQAEFGQAALKVGESVLGGMKFLGGMAYDAAKSRVSGGGGDVGRVGGEGFVSGGVGGRFVSRSAPDTSEGSESAQRLRERKFSNASTISGHHITTVAPSTTSTTTASGGYYITVLDLSPMLVSAGKEAASSATNAVLPIRIDEFMSSRSQPVAALHFSADGTSLAVIQRDGYVVKTFKIRPIASVVLSSGIFSGSRMDNSEAEMRKRWTGHLHQQTPSSVKMYTLRRGRTSAVVEGADWSKDGRWLAIGTRKRTVHVFPVNPYGGKTDIASHLEGRVRNVDSINHPLTELSPLIRLRGTRQSSTSDYPNAPLAFTFISPLDISQSPRLVPQQSIPNSRTSPTILSHQIPNQQQQFQDVLLFDPADGVLSLRRLSLDKHFVREQGLGMAAAAASVQALGVTSISLPRMGGAGRLARSPSRSGGGGVADPPVAELVAKESNVATWHLQRRTDWVEIKQRILNPDVNHQPGLGGDWLAEAELTTCSNSQHILPRSIYLSHQFSFHTLGEDYHALIRRHQFDICGEEIKVRKQVEISAYSSGGPGNNTAAAAFVEGFSAPRDIRRNISSSFDEPIASAISGSYDNSNLPAILPMYPNGIPSGKPKSFRNSIPIRTMAGIGDGVTEGFGRIRREMHKVRSPPLLPRSDSSMSGPVPLEFDEEDEDFLVRDVQDDNGSLKVPTTRHRDEASTSRGTSREGGTSAGSTSSLGLDTPADTSIIHHHHLPLVDDMSDVVGSVDEEIWSSSAWDIQDASAIDEAEQFDNISAVGYVDEELQARPPAIVSSKPVSSSNRKGRQKRK